jgi:hypothetical protein
MIEEDISDLRRDVDSLREIVFALMGQLPTATVAQFLAKQSQATCLAFLQVKTGDHRLTSRWGEPITRRSRVSGMPEPLPADDPVRLLVEELNRDGAGICLDPPQRSQK